MSRIQNKPSRLPDAFSANVIKTERATVAVLMHWMRNIIEANNIELGPPDVDTSAGDLKSPDIVIYESPRSQRALCVIEAKLPAADVYDEKALKEPAWNKARNRKARYFGVTNFRDLIIYDTDKVSLNSDEQDQIVNEYHLSEIDDANRIEQSRYQEPIKRQLARFLSDLYEYHIGKTPLPKLPVDERLVRRLHEKVQRLAKYYAEIIEDRANKDHKKFGRELSQWANKQGWDFSFNERDYSRAARQAAYLLCNKIMFYMALQAKRPRDLDPIEIPESLTRGELLRSNLESRFALVLKEIDYEEIFQTEFIDQEAYPDFEEVVEEIKSLVKILQRYNFAKLPFEIIGRIFERLIPADERHNLGQYFTNSDVVDLILRFCHHQEDDRILDPSCGAGTFLVRAYHHKKFMNRLKSHEELLHTIWGNDIAKFPTSLTTINLAIRDLSVDKNYPNILHKDFFEIRVGKEGCDLDTWRKMRAKTLRKSEIEITYPRYFDVIVGNPPYTRQEELRHISKDYGARKETLIAHSLLDLNGSRLASLSKRAGIHAYFFVHGWKFLKEGGYFGFIVSNSWLDVAYGAGLQEFFLKNYKMICIIESKVERWFADADVNTCIVILQKCKDENERDENLCRFAYLKKRLAHLIPAADETPGSDKRRFHAIDLLKETILNHDKFYENDELRIFPIKQADLWKEGYDPEEDAYVGAKWGKYLRAPQIFFTILEKGKGKLVPLKDLAKVRRGFTTGANEFFYLTEWELLKKRIEKEFWMHKDDHGNWAPNYVIKSPRECRSILLKSEDLKYRVLMIDKNRRGLKGKNVLQHIERGEKKKINVRPTCAGRSRWYDLGYQQPPDGIWFKAFNDRFLAPQTAGQFFSSDRFYAIYLNNKSFRNKLFLYLNCTLSALMVELFGRVNLGEGALDNMTYEAAAMLVLDIGKESISDGRVFKDFLQRPIKPIFEELGANYADDVSLNSVQPDRRALDQIIMGEVLGLTEEEQLEVYRAVVDLVRSRLDKAKSVAGGESEDQGELEEVSEDLMNSVKQNDEGKAS